LYFHTNLLELGILGPSCLPIEGFQLHPQRHLLMKISQPVKLDSNRTVFNPNSLFMGRRNPVPKMTLLFLELRGI